jgi:hypothetical protein
MKIGSNTVMRGIVLPVAGPVDGTTWTELRERLFASWSDVTACANWMLTELYARDTHREPAMEKLGRMPRIYLYPEARRQWPGLATQTLATLEHEVKKRWRTMRYAVLWTGRQSLPTQKYAVPLPLPRQMWRLEVREARYYVLSCRIGDARIGLRLRGGPHVYRQSQTLAEIVDGEVRAGCAYLYERVVHAGDHRTGTAKDRRLVVRISVEVPRRSVADLTGTLHVRTTAAALLECAQKEDGPAVWTEHAQQIRRALAGFARQQRQLSDDLKAERRRPRRQREGIVGRMGMLRRRRARQLDSWLHELAAHVVGYAKRHRVAVVQYDDRIRAFAESFPWYQLRLRLQEKCEAAGIVFARRAGRS